LAGFLKIVTPVLSMFLSCCCRP